MNCVRCGNHIDPANHPDEKVRACGTCYPAVKQQIDEFDAIAASHHKAQEGFRRMNLFLRPLKDALVLHYDDLSHIELHPADLQILKNLYDDAAQRPHRQASTEPVTLYGFTAGPQPLCVRGIVWLVLKTPGTFPVSIQLGDPDDCRTCMGTKKVRWTTVPAGVKALVLPWIPEHMRTVKTDAEGPCPACVPASAPPDTPTH